MSTPPSDDRANNENRQEDSEDDDTYILRGRHTLATDVGYLPIRRRRRGFRSVSKKPKPPSRPAISALHSSTDDCINLESDRPTSTQNPQQEKVKEEDELEDQVEKKEQEQEQERQDDLPCDTEIAILTLRSQFPGLDLPSFQSLPPILLRSQIYALVSSQTTVNTQLESLRLYNKIRLILLPGGKQEDFAVVHTDDYNYVIGQAIVGSEEGSRQREALAYFKDDIVGEGHQSVSITKPALNHDSKFDRSDELIKLGFLTANPRDTKLFDLSIPGIGLFIKNRRDGNKEVLRIVGRRPHGEILLNDLELKRLRRSCFDTRWHVRDLVGAGKMEIVETTVGKLVRFSQTQS